MTSLKNVKEFHMSGRRSVFTLQSGAKLDQLQLEEAYAKNGLKFESVKQETREPAKTFYVANAGIT